MKQTRGGCICGSFLQQVLTFCICSSRIRVVGIGFNLVTDEAKFIMLTCHTGALLSLRYKDNSFPVICRFAERISDAVDFEGCEWQILFGLFASFVPGSFGWSVAWLLASYPFSNYLVERFRTNRDRKSTRIAHPIPLTTVHHNVPVPVTLKVKIVKATLFAAALEENGLSDPYVIVELMVPGSEVLKYSTEIKYKTRTPVWSQEFTFQLKDIVPVRLAELKFTLMDKDLLKSDVNG